MSRLVLPTSFLRQPLDAMLSGVGSVRVLRALLGHGGFLAPSRIARETRMTPQGVRNTLGDLELAGAVEAAGSGRNRLYRALQSNLVVAGLEAAFAAERRRFEAVLRSLEEATADGPVSAAWLFGSVARGDDDRSSDLDLAVVLAVDEDAVSSVADRIRERIWEAGERLGFRPSVVPVTPADVRRLAAARDPFWTGLKRDAQVIKGPSPETLERELVPPRPGSEGVMRRDAEEPGLQ